MSDFWLNYTFHSQFLDILYCYILIFNFTISASFPLLIIYTQLPQNSGVFFGMLVLIQYISFHFNGGTDWCKSRNNNNYVNDTWESLIKFVSKCLTLWKAGRWFSSCFSLWKQDISWIHWKTFFFFFFWFYGLCDLTGSWGAQHEPCQH